jgi:hypothetical protein
MVEEDEDESPQVNMDETDEEVRDTCLAFDDDLDSEVNDFTMRMTLIVKSMTSP